GEAVPRPCRGRSALTSRAHVQRPPPRKGSRRPAPPRAGAAGAVAGATRGRGHGGGRAAARAPRRWERRARSAPSPLRSELPSRAPAPSPRAGLPRCPRALGVPPADPEAAPPRWAPAALSAPTAAPQRAHSRPSPHQGHERLCSWAFCCFYCHNPRQTRTVCVFVLHPACWRVQGLWFAWLCPVPCAWGCPVTRFDITLGKQRGGCGTAGHEAGHTKLLDVHKTKEDPESKHESVLLEDEIPTQKLHKIPLDQLFSDPSALYLLPVLGEVPSGEPPDPKNCSPQEYLEFYIFPVLLPGLAALLQEAEKENCFEGKRTKFIPSDFLTEWLYNNNPKKKDESFTELFSIPFVKDWLKDHPRPPVPLSLLLSEEEASILIQSFWRGYRVRCDSEIQELRQWQKKLREEKHITEVVRKFWAKQEAKVGSK
ncbi:IQ domain-containing protein K, partial [Prinia subflava]|uniref:IQ domain-containing protein K n=1 Tax=Prinia subflava TaxID=208062 RepID=UPI002FE1ABB7